MKADVKHGALSAATLRDIAAEAAAAFENGGPQIQPFSARHPGVTMDDAYRITALANGIRVGKGYKPIGRKIGFTNRRIWDEYGVHAPVWGYIYDRTLHDLSAPLSLAAFPEPKIEPEIMLGLAKAPSPGMDDDALMSCVAWVAHGYEMVQSIFPGWKFAPPDAVIVDGHHGALLIGPRHQIGTNASEWLRTLTRFEIELFCDGKLMDKGHALNVLEGPLSTIRYVVDLLTRDLDNPPLAAGEIISTGTVTRALPV
jgi:2-oxo-3-hexenedioate decarboxylase